VRYVRRLPDFLPGLAPGANASAVWSADTQRLVAFVFGLTVHYVTDEMWEGLTGQLAHGKGFVEQLDSMNLGMDGVGDVVGSASTCAPLSLTALGLFQVLLNA